jgi:hypothetical protein
MKYGDTSRHSLELDRINIADDYDLRAWADQFGVDKERVRQAVKSVGDRADAVERFLNPKPGQDRLRWL